MAMNKAYLTCGRDSGSDECFTPRYGVVPIVKHLQAKGFKTIWCPFDAEHSQYVRVLKDAGFNVVHSHIGDGRDFFEYEPEQYDAIVSNPPFSLKTKILKRCYDLDKPFALLLPQNSLQAISRVNMYMEHGLEYLGFDRRICFYTNFNFDSYNNQNHFASGYFCKGVLPKSMQFEKLNPMQEPYINEEQF